MASYPTRNSLSIFAGAALRGLLPSIYFLSGFCALIYEVLWARLITHVIGGSPYAVAIILAVFMAGLGLGSALGGLLADRFRSQVALLSGYGLLEIGVGLYALVLPVLLRWLQPAFGSLYRGLFAHAFIYNGAVFLLCLLLLLPPILCMGATWSFLGRFQVEGRDRAGAALGFLYGINTLGAACGVAAVGFWLIPRLGLDGSNTLAAAINLALGLLTLIVGRRMDWGPPAAAVQPSARQMTTGRQNAHPVPAPFLLAVFALSGFCAMAYEVVWTKVLGLVMGPTTFAFTTVLVVYITGLAAGSWAFGRLSDRAQNPLALLAVLQVGAALLALAASQRMGNSQFLFLKVDYAFGNAFAETLWVKGLFLAAFMLPPTVALGGSFPIVMRLLVKPGKRSGIQVGSAYGANSLGCVLGSFMAGFLFVPLLGSERTVGLLAALQLAGGLGVGLVGNRAGMTPKTRKPNSIAKITFLGAGALAAAALCIAYPRWNHQELSRAASRFPGPYLEEFSWWEAGRNPRQMPGSNLPEEQVFYGDGIGGFTSVWKSLDAIGGADYSLFVSGKADASSRKDMFTQVLLAHVPMLLHSAPRTAMVLGLASGVTAGEALSYPIERLDVLEINPQVVRASEFFRPWNGGALADRRTRLILQDAKAHLLLSRESYDVIIAEPSNPWMAGLAELFTREFFQRVRERLNEGGVYAHFLHSYAMDWETFSMIGRTFAKEFPNSILVRTLPDDRKLAGVASDYLLVGRKGSEPLRFDGEGKKSQGPIVGRNIRLADPALLYRMVEAENLSELFQDGPQHTDDRPLLEFSAPRHRFAIASRPIEEAILRLGKLGPAVKARADSLRADPSARAAFGEFALSLYKPFPHMSDLPGLSPERRVTYMERVAQYCDQNVVGNFQPFDGDSGILEHCSMHQMGALEKALKGSPFVEEIYLEMANVWMANGQYANAAQLYQAVSERVPGTAMAAFALESLENLRASLGSRVILYPP